MRPFSFSQVDHGTIFESVRLTFYIICIGLAGGK